MEGHNMNGVFNTICWTNDVVGDAHFSGELKQQHYLNKKKLGSKNPACLTNIRYKLMIIAFLSESVKEWKIKRVKVLKKESVNCKFPNNYFVS